MNTELINGSGLLSRCTSATQRTVVFKRKLDKCLPYHETGGKLDISVNVRCFLNVFLHLLLPLPAFSS